MLNYRKDMKVGTTINRHYYDMAVLTDFGSMFGQEMFPLLVVEGDLIYVTDLTRITRVVQ